MKKMSLNIRKNLELQNEALSYQKTIRDQEDRIRDLDERVKKFEMLTSYIAN